MDHSVLFNAVLAHESALDEQHTLDTEQLQRPMESMDNSDELAIHHVDQADLLAIRQVLRKELKEREPNERKYMSAL